MSSFTTRGASPVTVAAATILPAGVRVKELPFGRCSLADAATIGDYVTLEQIQAGKVGIGAAISNGGRVPLVASEDVREGDAAFTAENGRGGKKSPNSLHIRQWIDSARAGDIGQVDLLSPARASAPTLLYRKQI